MAPDTAQALDDDVPRVPPFKDGQGAMPRRRPPMSRRERQRVWQGRYRARVRNARVVPDMPDIAAEEVSFSVETR